VLATRIVLVTQRSLIMSPQQPLVPRQAVPDVSLALAGGGTWRLSQDGAQNFTLVVVYRGAHCPICKGYLADLQSKLPEFSAKGVNVIAVSSDTQERAEQTKRDWGLDALRIGYGLGFAEARAWGLYISSGKGKTSIGVEEPEYFVEPGLFLIRADGTLYFGSVQTMPFARPSFADVLKALDFVVARNYPARGEVVGLPASK
jgi:peroxiredoxin